MTENYIFTPIKGEEKEIFDESYLEHLHRRNGKVDIRNRRFSVREQYFKDVETNPIRRQGPPVVDRVVFERNEKLHNPEPGLDERTLWALAVAKSNRAEHDGVNFALSYFDPATRKPNDPLTDIEIEEFYHTRVLRDALEVLDLEMHLLSPHPATRALTRSMVYFPKPVSNVLIMCAEVVGVAAFSLLRDKAQELFDDQPEPLNRINELFQQIIVDEVGHVHYVRSQLGSTRLNLAEKMLPTFTYFFLKDMPEYKLLFGDKLMEEILKADVDGAAVDYKDRFEFPYSRK